MTVDPQMLCCWDPAMLLRERGDGTKDKWVRAVGQREIMIGASSRDIRLTGTIQIK